MDKWHLKAVAGDVGVWAAGVTSDGGDYAEDVSPGSDRDEPQVVIELSLAPYDYRHSLPYGRCRVGGCDRDLELGQRGCTQNECNGPDGGKSLHAPSTPQGLRSVHKAIVSAGMHSTRVLTAIAETIALVDALEAAARL
jgi:hypothetical protein